MEIKDLVIRISIEDERLNVREGVGKNGKAYKFITQEGFMLFGQSKNGRVVRVELKEEKPYSIGEYYLDPRTFKTNAFGEITTSDHFLMYPISSLGLIPVTAAASTASSATPNTGFNSAVKVPAGA